MIKLFSLAGKACFGWDVGSDVVGMRDIIPGSLASGLIRYARAEEYFPTGLEIDAIADDGSFLIMSQPFILGENPLFNDLDQWMYKQGWKPFQPITERRMLDELTWIKGGIIATDVRPENVICSGADGTFYSIDFIFADA